WAGTAVLCPRLPAPAAGRLAAPRRWARRAMLKRREFLALLLAPWLASCQSAGAGKGSLSSGLDLESLDRAVRPQDDLYQFVAGTWLRDTPIPPDRSNYGAFGMLQDQAYADVWAIAEAAVAGAATAPAGSGSQ